MKLQNQMSVETLSFAIECILSGAIDIIQMGLPDVVDAASRRAYSDSDDVTEKTEWERGAIDAAISSVSIITAQTTGEGIGNGDADETLGDFSGICERFIKANWAGEGLYLKRRMKRMGNSGHASDIYLDYPDVKKITRRFLDAIDIEFMMSLE